jgi:hypothetical protein
MVLNVIHIGKCGGSTVHAVLKQHKIPHTSIHIKKPIFHEKDTYLIVIRNPIDRCISAFNWRYKLVVLDKSQPTRFAGEKDILQKYACVNTFAENIAEFDIHTSYIHHIREDIHFYLHDFLKQCKKEHILGVITQENLYHDIQQLFPIHNTSIHLNKNNSKKDTTLSTVGYNALKQYLQKDYECIHRLWEMGCLTQEQYTILSK